MVINVKLNFIRVSLIFYKRTNIIINYCNWGKCKCMIPVLLSRKTLL